MANKATVEAQCSECKGSGVCSGFAEPNGVGVVCRQCEGSGSQTVEYTPFTERVRRTDIHTVRLPKANFAQLTAESTGIEVKYEDFLSFPPGAIPNFV